MDHLLLTDEASQIVKDATDDDDESASKYLTDLLRANQLRWRRAITELEGHGWDRSDLLLAVNLLEKTPFLPDCSGDGLKLELELAAVSDDHRRALVSRIGG